MDVGGNGLLINNGLASSVKILLTRLQSFN